MKKNRRAVYAGKCIAILSAVPILVLGHSAGPPPGAAGPPSDVTCGTVLCHVQSGGGKGGVRVSFPNGGLYTPGQKQHIVVTIWDPEQKRWGFQSTVRPADAPRSAMAGDFENTSENTQIVCNDDSPKPAGKACPDDPSTGQPPFQYVEHSLLGTQLGTRLAASFEFDWTPDTTQTGDLTFYLAANAANGDGTNLGDHTYYHNFTLHQAPAAGPAIGAVVNGGSFDDASSGDTWVTIQGTNLASTTRSWQGGDIHDGKLPTQLDDVSVTIGGQPAYVAYISPNQINVLAPSSLAGGANDVVVKNGQGTSQPAPTTSSAAAPALFLWNGMYAVALHTNYSLAAKAGLFDGVTTTPAKRGETILLYATGLGPTNPAADAGQVVTTALPLMAPLNVTIGGQKAEYSFAGLAPNYAGLYQINVTIPENAATGDQPILVDTGNGTTQAYAYITVQ